jgi:dTDP-4-amino-4,6-dideoxygalactose transaminase
MEGRDECRGDANEIVPRDGSEYSSGMILRRQLPAWSPLTAGALVAAFWPSADALSRIERRIAEEYQASSVILVQSGTVGLALGFLASAPEGDRPRIGLPAWGCFDLMTAADAVNAEVLLYDLDPHTLAPDLDSFRRTLGRGVHAIVVAHWFGLPVDLRPFASEIGAAGAVLIDDAAQGVGASFAGRPVGASGDFGVLSFGRGKGRTGGEGGAIIANSPRAEGRLREVAAKLARPPAAIRSYASLWTQWMFGRPAFYRLPASVPWLRLGETIYRSPPALRSMIDRSAAVLDRLWDLSAREGETRRQNADRWRQALKGTREVTPMVPPNDCNPGWLRFPVLAAESAITLLSDAACPYGVARGYPRPLAELPTAAGRITPTAERLEGSRKLARHLFTLPTHSRLTPRDIGAVAKLLA